MRAQKIGTRTMSGLAAAALWLLAATPVLADAIDGEWCHQASSLKIEGPAIRTPGGSSIAGDYSRHGFVYTVPANEPGAGTRVVMVLRGEELMELTRGAAPAESWRRCKPIS